VVNKDIVVECFRVQKIKPQLTFLRKTSHLNTNTGGQNDMPLSAQCT